MSVIKFDRDFESLFNWDTDENPTTEQDYQNAVKNWTETEMNLVDALLWQPTTEYSDGNMVKTPSLPSQYVLKCTEAGTSGSTEPSYSGASVGDTVTDGSVEWVIVSLATGNAADADASNVGVNAEVDNSEAWGNALGSGAIAEDDNRLVKGDTVYAVTSVMETNIATNTEAIEDNTEAIATNTETIAQHTTDIDIADKRISNIEKLLQGNLYDYQTDTDSKYTKTVPAGAMPWATLNNVGGKTVVWNQLNHYDAPTVTKSGITFTNNGDGSFTVTGTATARTTNYINATPTLSVTPSHKFVFVASCTDTSMYSHIFVDIYDNATWKRGVSSNNIFTMGANENVIKFVYIEVTPEMGEVNFTVRTILSDITLMYGAGNEPSTVAEFESMFPAQYYPYNAGTLLSAGVTEVVSKGYNLFDKSTARQGYFINGNDFSAPAADVAHSDYIAVSPNQTYYLSAVYTPGRNRWFEYDSNKNFISKNTIPTSGTFTVGSRTCFIRFNMLLTELNTCVFNVSTTTDGTYKPYHAPIITPIPAEIQALEGYGWSAGSVYNYVDFERKVFVKNVKSKTISDDTWVYNSTYGVFVDNGEQFADNPQWVCPLYPYGGMYSSAPDQSLCFIFVKRLGIKDSTLNGDVTALMNKINGVTAYCQARTPVETDISAYLTDDNLISVEAGGSLTFENQHGDDYRIEVPSQETYMVDLQEAI